MSRPSSPPPRSRPTTGAAGAIAKGAWQVDAGGATLAAFVKAQTGAPWSRVKKWIEDGKVAVDGTACQVIDHRLPVGAIVVIDPRAERPFDPEREAVIVYDDPHVVVIDKASGVSSVPYEERETGTAMDLIRGAWRRHGKEAAEVPLHIVHRIDKATSGLLMFGKSKRAELGLAEQLRDHSVERTYLCVAHGAVGAGRLESMLVGDRGDGLRGSTQFAGQGKRAVTHVTPVRAVGPDATLCEVRLETGRTHQIRIHLAEAGHPLVGDDVYNRDFFRAERPLLPSPRLLLHAATLGFVHPVSGERVRLRAELPDDFTAAMERLARRGGGNR